jgi:hypothetical protein
LDESPDEDSRKDAVRGLLDLRGKVDAVAEECKAFLKQTAIFTKK